MLCSLLQQINYRLAVHIQLYSNFIFFDGIPAESKYYVVRRNSYRSLQLLYLFVAPNALLRKDTARYDKEFFALLYRIVRCDQRAASVAGFGYEYRMRQRAYYPIALRKVILQRLCTHRVFADYQSLIDNLLLQI